MLRPDLLEEIRTSSPEEKQQLLSLLLHELDAGDDGLVVPNARYDVWSPHGSSE